MKNDFINKYAYKVEWDEADKIYIGRCLEMPMLAAHGKSPEAALKEINLVIRKVIEDMRANKEEIPEPFSLKPFKGNLTLRVPPEIHRKIALAAAEAGVSINQYILSKMAA
ncbi:MAG: toxin-antitoxin system HicB family antitoxin [Pseudomonadota bacterium]